MQTPQLLILWQNKTENAPYELQKAYGETVHTQLIALLRSPTDIKTIEEVFFERLIQKQPPQKAKFLPIAVLCALKRYADDNFGLLTPKNKDTHYTLCLNELREICWTQTDEPKDNSEKNAAVIFSLNKTLKGFSKKQRYLFLRRYWYYDTVADLALACNKSEAYVKKQLLKMRKRLEKHLTKQVGAVTVKDLSDAMLSIKEKYLLASLN